MIAFINDQLVLCGGIITNFEYVKELRKRGYDAVIMANGRNRELQDTYPTVPVEDIGDNSDVIIANWWMQCEKLIQFGGRKIQFVQGNDLKADYGDDLKEKCLKTRQDERWELLGVSDYALEWTGRKGTVIPNGINERFFINHNLERDIDILVEGADEPIKNIRETIAKAKSVSDNVAWLTRTDNHQYDVRVFENPPQEEIPKIYQRAKKFYKFSHSEGFCLPIVEARASGCEIVTWNQGHNFPKDFDPRDYTWKNSTDLLLKYLND